jgi:hypothetical protein
MHPITRNGKPVTIPRLRCAAGRSAIAMAVTVPAIAKLIHHDERSRIANSEFSLILQFTRGLARWKRPACRPASSIGLRT